MFAPAFIAIARLSKLRMNRNACDDDCFTRNTPSLQRDRGVIGRDEEPVMRAKRRVNPQAMGVEIRYHGMDWGILRPFVLPPQPRDDLGGEEMRAHHRIPTRRGIVI